jgi:hypothetical protein
MVDGGCDDCKLGVAPLDLRELRSLRSDNDTFEDKDRFAVDALTVSSLEYPVGGSW